jgi:hypothetical protein
VGHVEHMVEVRNFIKFGFESLKGGKHSEDIDVNDRLLLNWILGGWSA